MTFLSFKISFLSATLQKKKYTDRDNKENRGRRMWALLNTVVSSEEVFSPNKCNKMLL